MLDMDTFRHFAQSARPSAFYMNLYFQGEPFLNPDFFGMVQTARQLGYYTSTSTNGHYLTEANCEKLITAGLNRLTVSIDGTTQEVYRKYRVGGSLEKVLTGLQTLNEVKKRHKGKGPYVIFQFIVFGHNEHQIEEARAMADAYGVDAFVLKTAQINNLEQGAALVPKDENRSRYRVGQDGQVVLQNGLENHCWRMWSSLVVSWDGLVLPCCFDKDAKNAVGNLTQSSLKQVWRSDKYQAFRSQLFADRQSIDICQNCTEGHEVFVS
jgi:radical SAM protein with 4Fe4S-binding SPASM domain